MQFNAGRRLRLYGNAYRFSQLTDTYDLNRMADAIDVTVHENNDRNFVASLRSGGAQWGGIHDGSTARADEIIASQLGSTAVNVWTACLEGDAVGSIAHLYRAREKQLNVSSPAAGRVGVTGQHDATDHIMNGRVQIQGTILTATTGAKASVDNGAASTLGGVGHFHLTDLGASITVKVQHSSAGSAWADLLTFTSTGAHYAHLETTGLAIKRFTRGICTAVSGSTARIAVAFARKTA